MRFVRLTSLAIGVAFLAACDVAYLAAQGDRARGQFERTLAVNGAVELDVRTGSGTIAIRTGGTDRVQVTGRISAGRLRSGEDAADRVRRIEQAPPVAQAGNVITIGGGRGDELYRNVSISYEIVVPPETQITSRTGSGDQTIGNVNRSVRAQTGSGSIQIERTGGSLHAQTGSGNIRVDAVGGPVHAQTGSGSVTVRQTRPGDVTVRTGSGSVTLDLPEESGFTLDARTGSGGISTAQPIQLQGEIRRNHVIGTVRGGGNSVNVRTGSGSIDVR